MDSDSSAVLELPNAGPIVFPAGPLPRDVWPLVWDYLPIEDLVFASQTCRGWRADMLAISHLWAQLDLCVYDAEREPSVYDDDDDDDDEEPAAHAATLSNIRLLEHILPRSKSQLITLDVEVRAFSPDAQVRNDLIHFLELLSPRLAVLRMETDRSSFSGEILWHYGGPWTFPVLRTLGTTPPVGHTSTPWEAAVRGGDMPKLRHLVLHDDSRLYSEDAKWANLESLRCTVNTILHIEGLLLSANALQQLTCECFLGYLVSLEEAPHLTWPNQPIFDALSRIPDVCVAAVLEPASVDWIFDFFVNPPRPRLLVEFYVDEDVSIQQLKLKACAQLASATRLTVRPDGDDCIIFQLEDGSGSFFQIAFKELPPEGINLSIDWELVPSLGSLTSLRVDAALWPAVMRRFPHAPLLTDVALVIHKTDDIVALLRDGLVAQVPPGAKLTLTSEPISVTARHVADLTAALGVECLSLTGSVEMASS